MRFLLPARSIRTAFKGLVIVFGWGGLFWIDVLLLTLLHLLGLGWWGWENSVCSLSGRTHSGSRSHLYSSLSVFPGNGASFLHEHQKVAFFRNALLVSHAAHGAALPSCCPP